MKYLSRVEILLYDMSHKLILVHKNKKQCIYVFTLFQPDILQVFIHFDD